MKIDFNKLFLTICLVVIFSLITGCSQSTINDNSKLKVATTIYPLFDITRNIVGDKIDVVNVVKPGASPHTFSVTPRDILNLQGAKLFFQIGHGLDDWSVDISHSVDGIKTVVVDKEIELKTFGEGKNVNPHYWLSILNAEKIARNVTDEVSLIDPDNKEFYENNLKKYVSLLYCFSSFLGLFCGGVWT